MKIVTKLLFVFFILASKCLYSQWYEVSSSITDVCQTTNGAIYAVGGGGTIRKSINGGSAWKLLNTAITGDIYSVFFVNNSIGFASGEDGIIKTTDGGTTWSIVYAAAFNTNYYSVNFISENIGYIINDIGYIFKTTDGGSTWNSVYFSNPIGASSYQHFNQVLFITESIGYVCVTNHTDNSGIIYYTEDAGVNWEVVMTGRYVNFIDQYNGFAIRTANVISKTTDGGLSWNDYTIGINDYLSQIKFNSSGVGFAVGGYSGSILKTYDGGITWIYQQSHIQHGLGAITFDYASNNCIAVGSNATILKTVNGGANWDLLSLSPPSDSYISGGSFADDTTAFVLGSDGYVTRTEDGGITWMPVGLISGNINVFKDICFVNKYTGFVAADNEIWKTTDGGINWVLKTSGAGQSISKIFKLNQNELFFIAGYNPQYECSEMLFKTNDGGETWNDLNQYGVSSLDFYNDSTGILINRFQDKLLKTTDKGNTWSDWVYPDCDPCVSGNINLINAAESDLYIVGSGLWKSTDQGQSWYVMPQQSPMLGGTPEALYFTDHSNGYVLSGFGSFYKTNDGGVSFSNINYRGPGHNYAPHSFAFSNINGIAFGNIGAIYRPYIIDGGFLVNVPELKKKWNSQLIIYPNPNNGVFKIQSLNKLSDNLLEIYSDNGMRVFSRKMNNYNNENIDVSFLANGVYSIIAGNQYCKLIINK